MLKSLKNKNLLKGQFDTMKSAAANRKATQEAYQKIIESKQVFVPEQDPAFVNNASEGKDVLKSFFVPYEPPKKPAHPASSIKMPQSCLEKIKVGGFSTPLVGELYGWEHQTLGWRVNMVLTHQGDEDVQDLATGGGNLVHLGFVRCGGNPELTDEDRAKLRSIAGHHPAIAIVVSYSVPWLVTVLFLKNQ